MYFHLLLIVFVFFYSIDTSLLADIQWDYNDLGPDVWRDIFPACGGTSQSPINIKTACTAYQSFEPFQFSPAYNTIQNFTLINNGHTITAIQVNRDEYPLTLSGGGLPGTFTFANLHLHWGENYNSGSEHQM